MDQAYLEYLDTQLKKESDISIKNGFMKSYKILRSQDDDSSWNMLILREYDSFASLEKNAEKADEVLRQATGIDDQKGMQGYMDRSKIREVGAQSSCANWSLNKRLTEPSWDAPPLVFNPRRGRD